MTADKKAPVAKFFTDIAKYFVGIVGILLLICICLGIIQGFSNKSPTADYTNLPAGIGVPYTKAQAEALPEFKPSDFFWDPKTLPAKYQDVVVAAVNKIHREDSRCKEGIDPASASIAQNKSTKGHPVFYIPCGKLPNVVNVYFTPDDVKKGKVFTAPTYFRDAEGIGSLICQKYAKANANYPATVKFTGVSIDRLPDGRTIITHPFTAQNAYGVPDTLAVKCTFDSETMTDADVYHVVN